MAEGAGDGASAEGAFGFPVLLAGEDERDAGFVDQDGIGFVDEDGFELALDAVFDGEGTAVAEVVKAGFGGGEIGDVGGVGSAAFGGRGGLGDGGDGEAENFVDGAHPLGVAVGEIVVGGEDVNGFAVAGEEGGGGDGGEGFAFAGLHFDDASVEEGEGAPDLFGEEREAECATGGFYAAGEGGDGVFGVLEFVAELEVGERCELGGRLRNGGDFGAAIGGRVRQEHRPLRLALLPGSGGIRMLNWRNSEFCEPNYRGRRVSETG